MPPFKLSLVHSRTTLLLVSVYLSILFIHFQEASAKPNKSKVLNETLDKLKCNIEVKSEFVEPKHYPSEVNSSSATNRIEVNSNIFTPENDSTSEFHNFVRYSSHKQIKCASQQTAVFVISLDDFHSDESHGESSEWFRLANESLHQDEFCIEKVIKNDMSIQVCRDNFSLPSLTEGLENEDESKSTKPIELYNKERYFRKCCKEDEKIQVNHDGPAGVTYVCTPNINESVWSPALFPSVESSFNTHVHIEIDKPPKYSFGMPECSDIHELSNDKDTWFKVLENGMVKVGLKFWFRPAWLLVENQNSSAYCIDEVTKFTLHEETNMNFSYPFSSHEVLHRNQILLYCKIHRFDEYLFHRKLFGTLCVLASIVFAIILGIYLSVWDKQNLSGWTQFSIFCALFFVFLMEGTRTLVDSNALLIEVTVSCRVIALIAQIFFFAVNTSWSVMCWDLFWTFWKLESTDKPLKQHPKRVTAYLFFSWVLPVIVVIIAFYHSDNSAHDARERMEGIYQDAHRRCSSPIRDLGFKTQGIMFLINALFFIFTAFLIWRHRRGINASRRIAKSQKNNWRSVKLFGKLLIVMGVASLSVPMDYFFGSDDPLSPLAVIFRCVHFIPVASILFIFGFNEKNIRLINQKYPRFGKTFGVPFCPTKAITTDTNASPSGQGQQATTIAIAS